MEGAAASAPADMFWSAPRAAGALIVAGVLLGLGAIAMVAVFGNVRAAEAQFRDLESAVGFTGSLRVMGLAWAVPMLLVLAGFVVLATALTTKGHTYVPVLAAVAFAIFTFAWVIEAAFQSSVTVWAVEQVEQGREVPELFHELRRWLNVHLQVLVNPLALLAMIGLAHASRRAVVLPPWASWSLIVYCGLVLFFPLPLLIAPAIVFFGVVLLTFG